MSSPTDTPGSNERSLATSVALHARVRGYMRDTNADDFERLAFDIAAFQRGACAPIAQLYERSGFMDRASPTWCDLPGVPTETFRLIRIATHPATSDTNIFETSGTTSGGDLRGRHVFRTTETYKIGALLWAAACLWPNQNELDLVSLIPTGDAAPTSSLSFMVDGYARALDGNHSMVFDGQGIDVPALKEAVRQNGGQRPILVAGTSFAFVHLLDAMDGTTLQLPLASRVMYTGGFKGKSRAVDADELRASIARTFGIPEQHVLGEYGMTELSSQLYQPYRPLTDTISVPPGSGYRPPHWMRVVAVHPETLAPQPAGAEGLAQFVDLANIDSAVAVLTADRIRIEADASLTLLGRTPGSTPRGCSLAMEHLLR